MLATIALAAAFATTSCDHGGRYVPSFTRDWSQAPVVREVPRRGPIYAVSDVHGRLEKLTRLLAVNGLIGAFQGPDSYRWMAGEATLVVVGDMIDKGPESLEVLEFVRQLQQEAQAKGGTVVATMGNHEAEFLRNPFNRKATRRKGMATELEEAEEDPRALAAGQTPLGRWLRSLPLAAIVGDWFFAHAGYTHHRSRQQLATAIQEDVMARDYCGSETVGDDSILEARDWFAPAEVEAQRQALRVEHLVFGHQPKALGSPGRIAVSFDGALFRIDTGLVHRASQGELLFVHDDGGLERVDALDAAGQSRPLWSGRGLEAASVHK